MPQQNEIVPAQEDLNELARHAKSPEDRQALKELQDGFDEERREAYGDLPNETPKLVVQPDGTVETLENIAASQERDEEQSGAYSGGRRA